MFPGYVQVENFGDDDDYEEEEEISYVTLDLGTVEPTLLSSSSTYRLIGLDTDTPFLQLSGTVLKGQHNNLLGSDLVIYLFLDVNDRVNKPVAFAAQPDRRIAFKEVRLVPQGTAAPLPNAKSKGKGKGKSFETVLDFTVNEAIPEAPAFDVDRLTGENPPAPRRRGRKPKAAAEDDDDETEDPPAVRRKSGRKSKQAVPEESVVDDDDDEEEEEEEEGEPPAKKKRKSRKKDTQDTQE
ncbi:hypothetical protein C8J56DRAFT_1042611 [Mycena floridula]|nr:hypothetical protein C8J56DRAFT_1042611 [Mycena floridula]